MRQWINLFKDMTGLPVVDKWFAQSVLDTAIRLGFDMGNWENPNLNNIEHAIQQHVDEYILPNVQGNNLRIYRAIANSMIRPDQLGIHWTTDKSSAFPYWGKHTAQWYVLEGLVALKDVWWEGTMALHIEGGEFEVRLDKGVSVHIVNVTTHTMQSAVKGEPSEDDSVNYLIGQTLTT